MPGVGGCKWVNDRAAAERVYEKAAPEVARFRAKLYKREVSLSYKPGTLLLYRFDTWHRGSPLKFGAPDRRVLNFVYARGNVTHITPWNCRLHVPTKGVVTNIGMSAEEGFCRSMYFGAEFELNDASVLYKSQLGVPPPGDAYWTRAMQQAVVSRFPNGDWRAYMGGAA